ncbi:MAG: histidinol dehydrogenase [Planctomycetota bacterium]
MSEVVLRRVRPEDVGRQDRPAVTPRALADATEIVEAVRTAGEAAVRSYAERFGERRADEALVLGRSEMSAALDAIDSQTRALLERTAERIRVFAEAQREAIRPVEIGVPGGKAGHTVEPVSAAGCYAPGGRYPLPSSALMTAVTARAAGCERVVVASPGAHPVTVAAAAVAGADEFLCVGGAHGVAALAHGFGAFEPVDVIAGPGNAWVTAAKQLVSGTVGIDMLAGPSELLVLADDTADPDTVAADLLAQAEHDPEAAAYLVCRSESFAAGVDAALSRRLSGLSTAETARSGIANGFACVCGSLDESLAVTDRVAPEHLEVLIEDAEAVVARVRHAGGVFIGRSAAEVLGDYGAGPNHTLPTGGTARFRAGLSVIHFLRLRTWLRIDDGVEAAGLVEDAEALAEIEGLSGHAASARLRRAAD